MQIQFDWQDIIKIYKQRILGKWIVVRIDAGPQSQLEIKFKLIEDSYHDFHFIVKQMRNDKEGKISLTPEEAQQMREHYAQEHNELREK